MQVESERVASEIVQRGIHIRKVVEEEGEEEEEDQMMSEQANIIGLNEK